MSPALLRTPVLRLVRRVAPWTILVALTGCVDEIVLAHDLSESDANALVVAIDSSHSVSIRRAEAQDGRSRFEVVAPAYSEFEVRRKLVLLGLPKQPPEVDADNGEMPFTAPSDSEQRRRLALGLGAELERTLELHSPGVVASVQVALPAPLSLYDESMIDRAATVERAATARGVGSSSRPASSRPRPTASVLLRYRRESSVDEPSSGTGALGPFIDGAGRSDGVPADAPFTPAQVCAIVAKAVEGLQSDRVAVVYLPYEDPASLSPSGAPSAEAVEAAKKDLARQGFVFQRRTLALAGLGVAVLVAALVGYLVFALIRARGLVSASPADRPVAPAI